MSLSSIQKEIHQLNPKERAMLIDLLWVSLDEKRVKEIEASGPLSPRIELTRTSGVNYPPSMDLLPFVTFVPL